MVFYVIVSAKVLVVFIIFDIEVINGSVMETEIIVSIFKILDIVYSFVGGKVLFIFEVLVLFNFIEAKLYFIEITISAEVSFIVSIVESVIYDIIVEILFFVISIIEREIIVVEVIIFSGIWAIVSVNFVEEVLVFFVETISYIEVLGVFIVFIEVGLIVGKGIFFVTVYSFFEGIIIKSFIRLEIFIIDSRINGFIFDCTRFFFFVYSIIVDSS